VVTPLVAALAVYRCWSNESVRPARLHALAGAEPADRDTGARIQSPLGPALHGKFGRPEPCNLRHAASRKCSVNREVENATCGVTDYDRWSGLLH
jgi:hypothetical protein